MASMMPQLYKCKNPDCNNELSDVNRKCGKIKEFCCDNCRSHTRWINRVKPKPKPKPCAYCGKIFTPNKRKTAKYCSSTCNYRAYHKVVLHKECAFCHKPIEPSGRTKHCSRRCNVLASMNRYVNKMRLEQ